MQYGKINVIEKYDIIYLFYICEEITHINVFKTFVAYLMI